MLSNLYSKDNKIDHVIALVHGIRTYGDWQEDAKKFFEKDTKFRAYPVKYGYFNLFEFLLPLNYYRKKAADKIIEDIVTIRRKHPTAKLSIISHSFGTYNVSRLLFAQTELDNDVHSIIMCGAIVPNDFPWHLLHHRIKGNVRNDFSYLDFWPAIAKAITVGYGAIGTYGAQDNDVIDVRHEKKHSDYFSAETFQAWKSFIETGVSASTSNNNESFKRQGWTSFTGQFLLTTIAAVKWFFVPLLLILVTLWVHSDSMFSANELEGTWEGTINWEYEFAKEHLFGGIQDLADPLSIGDITFYFNRSTKQWNGFSTWILKANDLLYAKLAVKPVDIKIEDSGQTVSFGMHALCRQKVIDFEYGKFSEYRISLKRDMPSKYKGEMLRTDPVSTQTLKVGNVTLSK